MCGHFTELTLYRRDRKGENVKSPKEMDIDDDGGGGDYRRRSSRKTKPSGNDGGESRIRRRSSRNTTMSTAAEATKRPSGGLKQPAGGKHVKVFCGIF